MLSCFAGIACLAFFHNTLLSYIVPICGRPGLIFPVAKSAGMCYASISYEA